VQTYDVAHECNGVRLMGIERRQDMQATLINELILRLAALEYTVRALQRLAQNVHGPEAGL
jgi:hypothetical protein